MQGCLVSMNLACALNSHVDSVQSICENRVCDGISWEICKESSRQNNFIFRNIWAGNTSKELKSSLFNILAILESTSRFLERNAINFFGHICQCIVCFHNYSSCQWCCCWHYKNADNSSKFENFWFHANRTHITFVRRNKSRNFSCCYKISSSWYFLYCRTSQAMFKVSTLEPLQWSNSKNLQSILCIQVFFKCFTKTTNVNNDGKCFWKAQCGCFGILKRFIPILKVKLTYGWLICMIFEPILQNSVWYKSSMECKKPRNMKELLSHRAALVKHGNL